MNPKRIGAALFISLGPWLNNHIRCVILNGMVAGPSREKTILVVEDERPLAGAIQAKLEKNGFAVATARTAEQALHYLEDLERVDAIWLDHYLLGQENGLDFVTKFKAKDGKWKKVPIFVVSNTAGPDTVRSYIRFGVSKYYVKADHRLDGIIRDIKSFLDQPEE